MSAVRAEAAKRLLLTVSFEINSIQINGLRLFQFVVRVNLPLVVQSILGLISTGCGEGSSLLDLAVKRSAQPEGLLPCEPLFDRSITQPRCRLWGQS